MFNRRIYLDYASESPIDNRVLREVKKYSKITYANPSSWYREGVSAKKAIDHARERIAKYLGAHADEIYFLSGGTEGNNIALIGTVQSLHERGIAYEDMHILISAIEHSSVIESAQYLKEKGVIVETIPVKEDGVVDLVQLKKMIRTNTVIVSVMMVNNEIGTVEPIRDIAKIIREVRKEKAGKEIGKDESKSENINVNDGEKITSLVENAKYPLLHTDACQAIWQEINVEKLGVDLLTMDAIKAYGPRGIGLLYVRRKTLVSPIVYGGGQEKNLRSGTENVPAIMGFAKALEMISINREKIAKKIENLKKFFFVGLRKIDNNISENGMNIDNDTEKSPHLLNINIANIDSEYFVMQMDARGIACSTKSSCLKDKKDSYVLKAIGRDSNNAIRFSLGKGTKKSHIKKALRAIAEILSQTK